MTDRRTFIAGLALSPVIAAAPAMAMMATPSPDPVAAYWAAEIHGCSRDDVEALMSGMPDATAEAYPRLYGQTASQLEALYSAFEVNNPCV